MGAREVTARIAFLILVHNHPEQLRRLVDQLSAPWTQCYVHVDAKLSDRPFREALQGTDAVLLDPQERHEVYWGGASVVRASLALISNARRANPEVERFCLLSGADWPVRPIDEMADLMSSNQEFIRINRELHVGGGRLHDDNVTYRSFADVPSLNPRTGNPTLAKLAARFSRLRPRRLPPGLQIYHGSCWWCLSRAAIETVLDFADRNPTEMRWMLESHVPDEIVFSTILKASHLAPRITDDASISAPRSPFVHGAHYIDWQNPNPSLPRTLDVSDVAAVQASEAWFARKIDPATSAEFVASFSRKEIG